MTTHAATLRALLTRPGLSVVPSCFDAMSARLVERAGFEVAFMSGYAVSATQLAMPDAGLISYEEMVAQGRRICDAVRIPVIGDGDTGFGNPVNVKRTVRGYHHAGFACVMIEDQAYPKRCGFAHGVAVVDRQDAILRLRAALAARSEIPAAGGDKKQVLLVRYGGTRKLGGVQVWSVPAVHSNGISPAFLKGDIARQMKDNGLTAYVGPPGGYVLRFSNGLTAYLSGDTGVTAEQEIVVRKSLGANLVVMNIGGVFSTGPKEAAYVINDLVKPNAVIISHANEAGTKGGKPLPKSKTAAFQKMVKVPAYPSLSGVTMEFDGSAKCVKGCSM